MIPGALDAVGRLAGGFAHEVNNQMTVVIGFIDLVLRRVDIPPAVQPDLQRARSAAERTA